MKKNFSLIVSVVSCIMLVFCIVQMNSLQKEVALLKQQLDSNYNSLYTTAIDSRAYLENQMQEQLMKQNALFDSIKTDVQYSDNKVKKSKKNKKN